MSGFQPEDTGAVPVVRTKIMKIDTIKKWYKVCRKDWTRGGKYRFIRKLQKHKFKSIKRGAYKSVFTRCDFDYVVKVGYIDPTELMSSPYYVRPSYGTSHIMIQRRVSTKNAKKALRLIRDGLDRLDGYWCDDHDGNCGWLNGKPVIIDL